MVTLTGKFGSGVFSISTEYWGKTEVCEVIASRNLPQGGHPNGYRQKKDSRKTPVKQGPQDAAPEPNKINASTPYDFNGKNLTPYGALLPVITMMEKLDFQTQVEHTVSSNRIRRA